MSKILVESEEYFKLKEKVNKLTETNKSLKDKYVKLQKRNIVDLGISIEKFDTIKNENNKLKENIITIEQENKNLKKQKNQFLQDITLFKQKNEELVEENKNLSAMIEEFENRKKTLNEEKSYEQYKKEGISICLTAWQTQDYIEECLDSIESQTYFSDFNNYEILLGIDACEQTLEKVKSIQHKYRNLRVFMMDKNVGTYVVTNTMMSIAKYDWMLRADSDDILLSNCVEILMKNAINGNADLYRFYLQNFNNNILLSKDKTYGQILLNKKVFNAYGGYKDWKCAADSELIERTKSKINQYIINCVLYKRRIHQNSLTRKKDTKFGSDIRNSYKKYIETNSKNYPKIETITEKYTEIFPTYICKQYLNQIGIISLTSWKARINTVYKTLENLIEKCPNFHIVLCLSSEEFPKKEKELPQNILTLYDKIEVLWIKRNFKAFKKILFTIEKYKHLNIPIISADDDCLYTCNYAQELYDKWQNTSSDVIRYNMYNKNDNWQWTQGPCTLYPPFTFDILLGILPKLYSGAIVDLYNDDGYITKIIKQNKIHISHIYRGHNFCFKFHDEIEATNDNRQNKDFESCYK